MNNCSNCMCVCACKCNDWHLNTWIQTNTGQQSVIQLTLMNIHSLTHSLTFTLSLTNTHTHRQLY